jgi:hypothetical protein
MRILQTLAILGASFVLSTSLHAQRDETLVRGSMQFGGFGGPTVGVGRIAGETAIFAGGRGGAILGRRFIVGGAGVGLASELFPVAGFRERLEFGYGGLLLGTVVRPSKLVHLTAGVVLGGGNVSFERERRAVPIPPIAIAAPENDRVTVVEPELGVEINITDWMRLDLSGSYRFVGGTDPLGLLDNGRLSGGTGRLAFKFGAF